jgi:hypothetical protein
MEKGCPLVFLLVYSLVIHEEDAYVKSSDLLGPFQEGTLVSYKGESMAEEGKEAWKWRWLEGGVPWSREIVETSKKSRN